MQVMKPLLKPIEMIVKLERSNALDRLDHEQKEKEYRPFDVKGQYREEDEHLVTYVYPQEEFQDRLGILRQVIQHAQDLELLSVFLHTPFTKDITRNWAKAVITEDVLSSPSPQLDELLRLDLVSMISLKDSGNADLGDCYQVLFARDAPERRSSPEQFRKELAQGESTFLEARKHPLNLEKLEKNRASYSWIRLTHESERSFIQSYRDLLVASFGEADAFDEYLSDDEAIFLVAVPKMGPSVVAGGIYAWKDTTSLSRNSKEILLVTYEADGGVVRSEFQGNGLFTLLHREIYSYLEGKQDPFIDLVVGFCNITTPPALKAAARVGFTLVTETAAAYNFSLKPLRWRVKGTYIDEIGVYLPGNTLREIYGKGVLH
jgi:hypothetical protein